LIGHPLNRTDLTILQRCTPVKVMHMTATMTMLTTMMMVVKVMIMIMVMMDYRIELKCAIRTQPTINLLRWLLEKRLSAVIMTIAITARAIKVNFAAIKRLQA